LYVFCLFYTVLRIDADPDPAFYFDADPDPTTRFFPDLDTSMLQNDLVGLPTFHFDADPVHAFHFDADPDPQRWLYT
jgi:hypothetical protein